MYADVLLPLALDGLLTYRVPDSMAQNVRFGIRVIVPLGKSKRYIGVAIRVHDEEPKGYEVKEVIETIDVCDRFDKVDNVDIIDNVEDIENYRKLSKTRLSIITETQWQLWQWMSEYYMCPIGDVYVAATPAGLRNMESYKPKTETFVRLSQQFLTEQAMHIALEMLRRAEKQQRLFATFLELSEYGTAEVSREELVSAAHSSTVHCAALVKRGILETYEREVGRINDTTQPHPELLKPLSEAQNKAFKEIKSSFENHQVTLLHGVTSSGKTEIYIHLIQEQIEKGRQVLYLLPEIALTVQMMERLRRVFGNRLGIYHSKYSDAERVEIWLKQLSENPYDVILGARSAMFLPMKNLGLIIVDEEHETSFKQQDPAPRYHARDAAIMLASISKANVLLGTATPSVESFHNAATGKYGLVTLNQRYAGIQLPEIQIVDTADLQRRKMMSGPFSPLLLAKMREALEGEKQVILFQNRRGFAPMVECRQCGWVPHCDCCDVSLTVHRMLSALTCHYCGNTYRFPSECPACGSTELKDRGYGTEKIEDQIAEIFPEARIARMDLDTTRTRNSYERIIGDFSIGKTDILIGTQMVSKGLDFENVSVVGILNADSLLSIPDFRAYEQGFAMMSQVSGRAGRKGQRGLVILQTRDPKLSVIRQVQANDQAAFYQSQLAERQIFHYPPYHRLIYIYLRHKQDSVVERAALELSGKLRQAFGDRILGPDKPAVARVKMQCIRKIVVKLERGIDIKAAKAYMKKAVTSLDGPRYSSLTIHFDVDPL